MNTTMARTRPTVRPTALLVAAVLALLPLAAGPGAEPMLRVVVQPAASLDDAAAAVLDVAPHTAAVVGRLDQLGLLVAEVPATLVASLSDDPRTAVVTTDRGLDVAAATFEDAAASPTLAAIGADEAWAAGHDGSGVGIAVVDTGVDAAHPDLDGRVVAAIDVSGDRSADDPHGHGTALAGLAAGDGSASAGRHAGVAPGAHVVAVKVADRNGRTTLTSVLAGLEAVAVTADELDVQVVLLALSGPASDEADPLALALEQLWARGLVVVVPAGNAGAEGLTSPGNDPYLLTAGALDTNATVSSDDDSVPAWSGSGASTAGHAKPELLAPGVSLVGPLASGSTVARRHPDAIVETSYVRGSGTSMAAAVLAGAAATVLDAEPELTPDQVKGRLLATATAAPADAAPGTTGHGVAHAARAATVSADAGNRHLPPLHVLEQSDRGSRGEGRSVAQDRGRDERARRAASQVAAWRIDGSTELTAWNWTAWNWTAWNWTAWNWTAWNWTAWNWTAWNWTAWNWTAHSWGS